MGNPSLYPRRIQSRLIEALADTPVVLLTGPRQSGKTTLVRGITAEGMRYLTLDDQLTLMSAQQDPVGFIRALDRAVIDEIQRAPALLLAIKKSVDEDRRPGRFLLTGSANLMALPTVADSLAGRMENLLLMPLSQCEVEGHSTNWIDSVFDGRIPQPGQYLAEMNLVDRVLRGGYPEAIARPTSRRRTVWAQQYINALIQRDVRDIAAIEKLDHLPRFLSALAQMAGQMCNYTQLGAQLGLDNKTASKYVGVFEQMYLLKRIEVWAHNRLNRVLKTAKLQFIDSGLLAMLQGLTANEVQQNRTRFGNVLESFVYGELLKATTTSEGVYSLMYYRDADQVEVDIVIENTVGDLVGVEVKASATVKDSDLRGLRKLSGLAGSKFKMGIVLYDGDDTLPLGNNLWAAPLATLWGRP
ncbi:ATP-binding protein [Limnobacter humi]|uniref:ATP-binding protein n=1 Tax=Limnobacter humi TaxID=1778671 RepID=A0ABT1WIR7_9BURK|nr:ATP-binding protein [Limnobacter humi]MCQ8897402.1 ATP-binding protein [Limnobacter humi]